MKDVLCPMRRVWPGTFRIPILIWGGLLKIQMVESLLDKELFLCDPALSGLSPGSQLSCPGRNTVTFWLHSLHLFKGLRFTMDFCGWFWIVSYLHHLDFFERLQIEVRQCYSEDLQKSTGCDGLRATMGTPSPALAELCALPDKAVQEPDKSRVFSGWHWSILSMIMWVLWVPWGRDCGFPYVLSCSKIVAGILWTKANKSKPVFSHALQNLLHFGTRKPRTAHCRLCQIIPPLHTWTLLHFPHT